MPYDETDSNKKKTVKEFIKQQIIITQKALVLNKNKLDLFLKSPRSYFRIKNQTTREYGVPVAVAVTKSGKFVLIPTRRSRINQHKYPMIPELTAVVKITDKKTKDISIKPVIISDFGSDSSSEWLLENEGVHRLLSYSLSLLRNLGQKFEYMRIERFQEELQSMGEKGNIVASNLEAVRTSGKNGKKFYVKNEETESYIFDCLEQAEMLYNNDLEDEKQKTVLKR